MKIKVLQPDLIKILHLAGNIIKTDSKAMVMNNVLINADKESIKVNATNLISGISAKLVGECLDSGSVVLPINQLSEYVQTLLPEEILIESKESKLLVKQKNCSATFPVASAEDYPTLPEREKEKGIVVGCEELNSVIKKALVAVSDDDSRPALTGIFLQSKEAGVLQVVSTDGYRLGVTILNIDGVLNRTMLIPAKALASLTKGVNTPSISIGIDLKNNQFWLEWEGSVAIIRPIMEEFPDFNRIFPTTYTTRVTIDRDDLLRAVQQMAVFARQNANIIRCQVDKKLKMFTQEGIAGGGDVEIEAKIEGEPLEIAFNFRYLREYLAVCPAGDVVVDFNGPLAPTKFTSPADVNTTHIIMPVKF